MAETENCPEQKQEPRYNVRIAIFYGVNPHELVTNYTVNLSSGGLFIETKETLPVDTILCVEFKLPDRSNVISCKARVAWVIEENSNKKPSFPPGMGLHFLTLSLEDIRTIREYLCDYDLVPTW
jgi:uncharacterized protein (TIGR02266 family)